jgi:prophage regulatory protein
MEKTTMFLRLPKVIERTGLSRSSIYAMINTGHFPPPVNIGQRAVAWREADLEQWAANRRALNPE